MNEREIEATISALRTLCARLETLRHLDGVQVVLSHQQKPYEHILEDAYAALAQLDRPGSRLRP